MTSPRWPGLALATLLLCACSDESGESPDAGPVDPPVASSLDYNLAVDDAWCARFSQCTDRVSYESCRARLWLDRGFAWYAWVDAQVASGRVLFHGDRAAACLRAIESASCAAAVGFEWADRVDPVCLTVFEPALKEGDACDYVPDGRGYTECAYELECNPVCDFDQCCQGTCGLPWGAEEPLPPPGKEGAACASHSDCEWQLACGQGGTCIVPRNSGDACWHYCAGDYICRDGVCQGYGVVNGETTCDDGVSDTSLCDADHYCATNGKCYEFAAAGGRCGPGVGFCDWFHDCNPDSMKCELKRSEGAACTRDTECQGLRSTCTNGVCTAPKANGEACGEAVECMSNHCEAGACRAAQLCDGVNGT